MVNYIGIMTLLVRDYDEAIVWFRESLGFEVKEDVLLQNGNPLTTRRWIVVGPPVIEGQLTVGILLSKADGFDELEAVGTCHLEKIFSNLDQKNVLICLKN